MIQKFWQYNHIEKGNSFKKQQDVHSESHMEFQYSSISYFLLPFRS